MILFKDRKDAGQKLALKLTKYKNLSNTIVLGLPRGGVVIAAEISKSLKLPLDIIVIRKMGAPFNPELAIGAVDDEGHRILNDAVIEDLNIDSSYVENESATEKEKALSQMKQFRGNSPALHLKHKTVLLADDGLATGATMKAALFSAKKKGASKIVVAVPVAAIESLKKIEKEVDEIIYIEAPFHFGAVGSFYENFDQTSDEEVIELLHCQNKFNN